MQLKGRCGVDTFWGVSHREMIMVVLFARYVKGSGREESVSGLTPCFDHIVWHSTFGSSTKTISRRAHLHRPILTH